MTISIHLRALIPRIYLPSLLTASAQNAILVLLPLYVLSLGYSAQMAALIFACRGLGTLIGDLPAGKIIARYGDRNGMLTGSSIIVVSCLLLGSATDIRLIALAALGIGCGGAGNILSRQSYITERYSSAVRGRILSLLGGTMRAGTLIGPLLGGILVSLSSYSAVFYLLAALVLGSMLFIFHNVEHASAAHHEAHASPLNTLAHFTENKHIFLTAGLCMIGLQIMRASRTLLIPIIGASMGLDVELIGLIVAAGALFDLLMFYPAGIMMDKYGRRFTAIPCFLIYAFGLSMLGFADSESMLFLVAIILGLGNGLSSGLILILGSDYAPTNNRGPFLSVWRLFTDLGGASAPALMGLILKFGSLAFSGLLAASAGLAAAAIMVVLVKEPRQHSQTKFDKSG